MSSLDVGSTTPTCYLDLLASTALKHSENDPSIDLSDADPPARSVSASPAFSSTNGHARGVRASPSVGKNAGEPKYQTPISPALLPSPYLTSTPNVTRTLHGNGRHRSDSINTLGSESSKRSSPTSPSLHPAKRAREGSGGQEWSDEETRAFYRVKQQLAAIHPKLRIGASRNVGVGRVRLQCKVGVTVSTIRTFGVEEIHEILRVAQDWARDKGSDEDIEASLKRQGGCRTPKARSQSVDAGSMANGARGMFHPLTPQFGASSSTSHTTPLSLGPPAPLPAEKEKKIRVFCERLTEFLAGELRVLLQPKPEGS